MNIRKAVITAAGPNQRTTPLQQIIDRDGTEKSALRIIVEEAASAGVEEICIVVQPGDQSAYAKAIGSVGPAVSFVEQKELRGYGHAIACAREFAAGEPILHLVGDHIYGTQTKVRCAQQVVAVAKEHACAVSAVQATRESQLPYFGAVGGKLLGHSDILYEVDCVLEKPTPTQAEQHLVVPGLRAGYYLCLFGIHVLTPVVMDVLKHLSQGGHRGPIQLSDALAELTQKEKYLALQVQGTRYDIGVRYGLLEAQLGLALDGRDRVEVLSMILSLLAEREAVKPTPDPEK